jgi:N utilization substance protein B
MISRRLLRIKVLQALYAHYKRETESMDIAEKELFHSIEKTHELYHYLILLLFDLVKHAWERIEIARQKKIPSYEDLHPNMKFVNNAFIKQLADNADLTSFIKKKGFSWVPYPDLIRKLYQDLVVSEFYLEYMASSEGSYEEDKAFVMKVFSKILLYSDDLLQNLEEQSIYWNDELDFVIGMLLRSFRKFRQEDGPSVRLMQLYKNEEDKEFTKILFRKTILLHQEYLKMIETYSDNWEVDRIAFMDVLIMEMAICELREFAEIPVKVTINEYIEIAKLYSTEKSGTFVNGILDRIVQQLKADKKLVKWGRGLIGET